MEKRFIVLIDFSACSNSLLKYASQWSAEADAKLLLVHQSIVVAPAFMDPESKESVVRDVNNEALEKLKILAGEIVSEKSEIEYSVSDNHLQLTLERLLQEPYEHLIFVGLKSTSLLKKLFIGNTALEMIDNTNEIVVTIPVEVDRFSHRKIFIAVSDKHPINILALRKLFYSFSTKETSITFFHLTKPGENAHEIEKYLSELAVMFGEDYRANYAIYEGNNPFEDIKKVINNKIDEILVVQKGSRILTDQLFRKFAINELVYEGQTPLIVLPQ